MSADEMKFRKPDVGEDVCCFFWEGENIRHTSAVVILSYDDGSCLLAAPGKDAETILRLTSMPFATGPATPSWHWPRKTMICPSCKGGGS